MRVLVTGADGQLGSEVVAQLDAKARSVVRGRPVEVLSATRKHFDVTSRSATLAEVVGAQPDVIIHCAAWTAVDACETDPVKAFAVNAFGTRNLAEAADLAKAHLCYVSTDYVFNGRLERPYTEWDETGPLNAYGASKLAGERQLGPSATVVRTSWVFGRVGANIVKTVLRLAGEGAELCFVEDQIGSPTSAQDLAGKLIELAIARRRGVYHVTNEGSTSWYEFARAVLAAAGQPASRVRPITTAELQPPRPAARPANSVLENAALRLAGDSLLAGWEGSLRSVVQSLVNG